MQKKHLILAAACAAAMLLAGCAESHTHVAADGWTADTQRHWQSCTECGKNMNKGAHTLDDASICTVCGAEIVDWGDSKSVYQFTAQGDPLRMADYDASGRVVS